MAKKKHTGVKNQHAVALGGLGGKKGGPARDKALPHVTKVAIGKQGAEARWGRHRVTKSLAKRVKARGKKK